MSDWQDRVDAVWADDALSPEAVIARIDELAAERVEDDAVALFERAGARDSAGRESEAEALYRRALAVLTRIVVDVGETSGVELELSSSSARTHGGLSCLTLMPG